MAAKINGVFELDDHSFDFTAIAFGRIGGQNIGATLSDDTKKTLSDLDYNIDEVIDEPLGGAHRNPDQAALLLKKSIIKNLDNLKSQSISTLLDTRYKRLMSYGNK